MQPVLYTGIKLLVAACGAALLIADVWLERVGRPDVARRARDTLLVVCAVVAGLAWWNFLQFQQRFVHLPDVYHYYIGAKYFPELRYTRLYECTAVADRAAGPRTGVLDRTLRDLESNRIEPTAGILADPQRCTSHFSRERWAAFARDVAWFRERTPLEYWHLSQRDHGYNATPAWGVLGTSLANLAPASAGWILGLTLLDPLLWVAMWACVGWAFGWRSMCVGLIFFGTNALSTFEWTGGGFLRQDWLAATVVGICLLRRGRSLGAGFLLTWATLLRIFPGAVLAALALRGAIAMWRRRSLRPSDTERRLALGCLLALLVLLPASVLWAGSADAWLEFAENSRTHLRTPTLNYVGLQAVLWYDHDTRFAALWDPAVDDTDAWKRSRLEVLAGRRLVWAVLLLVHLALLARALAGREAWAAAVLGIGLVPMLTLLSGYYYSVLVVFALPAARWRLVGAALCGLSAALAVLAVTFRMIDEFHTWASLATVAFVFAVTLGIGRTREPRDLRRAP